MRYRSVYVPIRPIQSGAALLQPLSHLFTIAIAFLVLDCDVSQPQPDKPPRGGGEETAQASWRHGPGRSGPPVTVNPALGGGAPVFQKLGFWLNAVACMNGIFVKRKELFGRRCIMLHPVCVQVHNFNSRQFFFFFFLYV